MESAFWPFCSLNLHVELPPARRSLRHVAQGDAPAENQPATHVLSLCNAIGCPLDSKYALPACA
eukprot:4600656-Pleurochrysis_carterae.AAC.2